MAKKKNKWHKKHISTKWGIAIIGFLLVAVALLIPALKNSQLFQSNALTNSYSCNNSGGSCMPRGICSGERPYYDIDQKNSGKCRTRFGNSYTCCSPTPRTRCEGKGGQYFNAYQNRVPNASYEQFPNLYPGHCFRLKPGCSNNGTPQSAGCVCSANASTGLLNACKSNLGCKSMSDGIRDTNGNSVYITGREIVYVTGMDRKRSSYVARIYANSNTNTYITKNVLNVQGICTTLP